MATNIPLTAIKINMMTGFSAFDPVKMKPTRNVEMEYPIENMNDENP
ncbi:MAG: hypothetical protein ACXAES_15975 [Promethearchaeota archaeon]|jgi:hypothetical protein